MDFRIDTAAPRLPDDIERLTAVDVEGILAGAHEICSTEADNDTDTWFLTRAGQFVRRTGEGADRFYVWPIDEAFDFLGDLVEAEAWSRVTALLEEASITLPTPRAKTTSTPM